MHRLNYYEPECSLRAFRLLRNFSLMIDPVRNVCLKIGPKFCCFRSGYGRCLSHFVSSTQIYACTITTNSLASARRPLQFEFFERGPRTASQNLCASPSAAAGFPSGARLNYYSIDLSSSGPYHSCASA